MKDTLASTVSNLGLRDWTSSAKITKPTPQTKLCLPIPSYVLPVMVVKSANLAL